MLTELIEAVSNIRENWKRALLTSSGVMAATIATMLLASIAIGVKKDFTDQVEDLGVNTIIVIPSKIGNGFPNMNLGGASYLKEEDAIAIRNRNRSGSEVGGIAGINVDSINVRSDRVTILDDWLTGICGIKARPPFRQLAHECSNVLLSHETPSPQALR